MRFKMFLTDEMYKQLRDSDDPDKKNYKLATWNNVEMTLNDQYLRMVKTVDIHVAAGQSVETTISLYTIPEISVDGKVYFEVDGNLYEVVKTHRGNRPDKDGLFSSD